MKKIIPLILFLTVFSSVYSQEFDIELMKKLSKISFYSIDNFMKDGYGYKKIGNEDGKRTYARTYSDDYEDTIIISVVSPKGKPNQLEIYLAKNFDIQSVKDIIRKDGYEYHNTNEYGLIVFKKEKSMFLISKEPAKNGANQLLMMNEF
jgi:hypothetical protein